MAKENLISGLDDRRAGTSDISGRLPALLMKRGYLIPEVDIQRNLYYRMYVRRQMRHRCRPRQVNPHGRCTSLIAYSHRYSVHLTNTRGNPRVNSSIPLTAKFSNSLPRFVIMPHYYLESSKMGAPEMVHFDGQVAVRFQNLATLLLQASK